MKIGDKVKVISHNYVPNNGDRKSAWPIGSIGIITSVNNPWDEPLDKQGVGIVDLEGNRLWGFHVNELELITPKKNYVEFHDADGMKLSFPRNSFFVTEGTDGGATIHLLERMIFWQVKETYEEVMKKVEE